VGRHAVAHDPAACPPEGDEERIARIGAAGAGREDDVNAFRSAASIAASSSST
jgi:hypothetical protein